MFVQRRQQFFPWDVQRPQMDYGRRVPDVRSRFTSICNHRDNLLYFLLLFLLNAPTFCINLSQLRNMPVVVMQGREGGVWMGLTNKRFEKYASPYLQGNM